MQALVGFGERGLDRCGLSLGGGAQRRYNEIAMKNAVRIALLAMLFPSVANAVECRSVGGHWGGKQVSAVRQVEVVGQSIAVTGTFEGPL